MSTFNSDHSSNTRSVLHRFAHRWVIDEFSHFTANTSGSQSIKSSVFSPSANKALQFNVELFPKGENEVAKDHLSVFLHLHGAPDDQSVPIGYEFSIIDKDSSKNNILEGKYNFEKGAKGHGFDKFVSISELTSKEWLPNDRLTIYCQITVYRQTCTTDYNSNAFTQEELEANAQQKILEALGKLLKSPKMSDVTVVVDFNGDKKEFELHKLMLSSRSDVFQAMFTHDTKENRENKVEISDIPVLVFEEFAKFVYTGDCNLTDDNAKELLKVANKYNVDLLKQMCGRALCAQICNAKVADLLIFAEKFVVKELKNCCIDYITDHATNVMITEGWKSLAQQDPKLMVDLFRQLAIKNHPKDVQEGLR